MGLLSRPVPRHHLVSTTPAKGGAAMSRAKPRAPLYLLRRLMNATVLRAIYT